MSRPTGTSELARKYRAEYPDMPTLKLARIMYADHPLSFPNLDGARSRLRYIEGKYGSKNKRSVEGGEFVREEPRPYNPYSLPASDETVWEPFVLNAKRVLVLSDIHVPYHSVSALTAAFDWGKERDPDAILLNGDAIDFHGISRFVRDPTKKKFADELAIFAELFIVLQKTFPKAKIYFKVGNHEERYDAFLWQKAKEISGVK